MSSANEIENRRNKIAHFMAEVFGYESGEDVTDAGYRAVTRRLQAEERIELDVSKWTLRRRDLPAIVEDGLIEAYIDAPLERAADRMMKNLEDADEDDQVDDPFCYGQVCGDEACTRAIEECREAYGILAQRDKPDNFHEAQQQGVEPVPPRNDAGNARAYVHWASGEYWFVNCGHSPFDIPFEDVAKICEWYPSGGAGLTQSTVVRKILNDLDRDMTDGVLKKVIKALGVDKSSPPLAPHVTMAATSEEEIDEAARLYHEKQVAGVEKKYNEKAHRMLRKEMTDVKTQLAQRNDFIESVLEAASLEPLDVEAPALDFDHERFYDPVFVISDLHLGKEYDGEDDSYNLEVAWSRAKDHAKQIVESLADDARTPGTIRLVMVGDTIDGALANIYPEQWRVQDVSGLRQIEEAAQILAFIVDFVQEAVGTVPVDVHTVPGNHGRSGGKRNNDPTRLPELMTYKLAESYSGRTGEWDIEEGTVNEVDVPGYDTKILLTHGDRTPREIRDLGWSYPAKHVLVISGHSHTGQVDGATDGNVVHVRGGAYSGADEFEKDICAKRFRPSQAKVELTDRGPAPSGWFLLDRGVCKSE